MDEESVITLSANVKQDLSCMDPAVPSDAIDALVRTVCDHLCASSTSSSKTKEALKGLESRKPLLDRLGSTKLAQVYSALSILLLEAAKENLSSDRLNSTLKSSGWSSTQSEIVSAVYQDQRERIRAMLKLYGPRPQRLVDVNWRLDYRIETSSGGAANRLLYLIQLTLEDGQGVREDLTFTADHAGLEDLVNTLKDACHSVQRAASSN